MFFNSIGFAFFLPIVFAFYWFFANKNLKMQNILLLLSSYFFYSCWDWRFLFLLLFSTFLDYFSGLKMSNAKNLNIKKAWFWTSISVNIGFLGVFKYYNFFASSFTDAVSTLGFNLNPSTINVILPVGISFYTFHGLSYVIDIYKDRINPEKNFIDYSVFVSFFPLLVAGPIERATHLLPQIKKERIFNYATAVDGLKQILWGLFKKVVIADQCAEYANIVFNNSSNYSGSTLLLGAVFFSFQIYCDFSGYSDMALGTARLFGIELLRNFSFPYFSRDIAEFWRRWHISLSTWFRDYLYIPLGGSKGEAWMKVRNILIVFLVSGFWHGANWTFIIWGLLNALYIMPSILLNTNRDNIDIVAKGKTFPTLKELFNIVQTFGLITMAWIFFRAENVWNAIIIIGTIFSNSLFKTPDLSILKNTLTIILTVLIFVIIEWMGRENQYAIAQLGTKLKRPYRWAIYYSMIIVILYNGNKSQEFIYFQF
jgi:alginate O-acetyltransferase complex protein AlgI